ncbi:MAG: DUF4167 domain-containing protein [Kiloniellales bacterium]
MRQQPSGRRPRGRSNRNKYVSPKAQNYDSHGPDVRVRGNAMQVYEKYLNLARDASSAGDRIVAEGCYQFAEHYFRILNDSTDPQRTSPDQQRTSPDQQQTSPDQQQTSPDQQRTSPERPHDAPQPYPVHAEQPIIDGAGAKPLDGNGQAQPMAGEATDGGADPAATDGEQPPAAPEKAITKPRGRGRPRSKAKAGNGAADDSGDDEEPSAESASDAPSKTDSADA